MGVGRDQMDSGGHGWRVENEAAADIAEQAGHLLVELSRHTEPGQARGKEGDRQAHQLITGLIGERFPDDRIRSEEGDRSTPLDTSAGRVWVVDPLDGTREYSEGRDDWAVHVALVVNGHPLVGAVALPALGLVLGTGAPPPVAPPAAVARMVVSRSRPPQFIPALAERLGAITVPMGSAGAKIAAVIRGQAEIYVHDGGQYEWDSAAPVAVALASGLHAARLDGTPLSYARPDPWLPDLVVCHPDLTVAVTEALEASGASSTVG
jgi:3'(2'), 5'-bisphosphate nucleotidase